MFGQANTHTSTMLRLQMKAGPLLMVLLLDGGLASHWHAAFGGLASLGSLVTWVIGNELKQPARKQEDESQPKSTGSCGQHFLVNKPRSRRKLGKCGGPAKAESHGGHGLCAADHGVQPASC